MNYVEKIFGEVNQDLKEQLADAEAQRHGPHFQRLLKTLVKFTNSQEENEKEAEQADEKEPAPMPTCTHENIGLDGRCKKCKAKIFGGQVGA